MNQEVFSSEALLVEALRRGEPKAYEKIYRDSLLNILSFVYQNRGEEADAKDLLQDAMEVLFEKLSKSEFVLTCKVTTYLYSICRYKWLNKLRADRLISETFGINKSNVKLVDVGEYYETPDLVEDEALIELEEKVGSALKRLDYVCQDILTRFYFYNKKLEEIALSNRFSSGDAVKVKKFRCMQKLKELIKR